jgi:hypothetical protein
MNFFQKNYDLHFPHLKNLWRSFLCVSPSGETDVTCRFLPFFLAQKLLAYKVTEGVEMSRLSSTDKRSIRQLCSGGVVLSYWSRIVFALILGLLLNVDAFAVVKNLYFTAPDSQNNPTQPQVMSRTPLTANPPVPRRIRIRRQDTPRVWAQTPATQMSLTLTAGSIPVVLQMRRNNNTQTRNIRVTLDYIGTATGTLGFVDVNVPATGPTGLSRTVTRSFTFTVPNAAVTLPIGTQIRVTVDNSPTGGNGRAIFVYPYDNATGNTSQVQLNTSTVINVDSVAFYDAAYAGGNAVPGVAPGQTAYVRTVISDPFGAYDITSATTAMTAGPCTIGSAVMTELVPLATASTKTFESVVLNTTVADGSTCTATVTGNEGTEGVTDTNAANLLVGYPSLTILKSTSGTPKPGQTLTYSIAVANTGSGYTNSLELRDVMSTYSAFGLTALPPSTAPFTLSDGVPCGTASGITFGTPEYANDRPPTYGYVPGATGWDGAITAWRIQPMTGSMNPGSCFTMQYQAQVK